jgi:hypothetical protein
MATRTKRAVPSDATPDAPLHPEDPTPDRLPRHRRGGQELPDDVQDRPEQNAGYDAAAHGEAEAPSTGTVDELTADPVRRDQAGMSVRDVPDALDGEQPPESPDDRAEREVVTEVRRRERRR